MKTHAFGSLDPAAIAVEQEAQPNGGEMPVLKVIAICVRLYRPVLIEASSWPKSTTASAKMRQGRDLEVGCNCFQHATVLNLTASLSAVVV